MKQYYNLNQMDESGSAQLIALLMQKLLVEQVQGKPTEETRTLSVSISTEEFHRLGDHFRVCIGFDPDAPEEDHSCELVLQEWQNGTQTPLPPGYGKDFVEGFLKA